MRFTRKDVRDATGWSDTQLRVHLDRLTEMEYLIAQRGMRGVSFEYELLYDGACNEKPHLSGLIDAAAMSTTASSRGDGVGFAGPTRGQNAPNAGTSRGDRNAETQALVRRFEHLPSDEAKTHVSTSNGKSSSYPQAPSVFPLAASPTFAHGD